MLLHIHIHICFTRNLDLFCTNANPLEFGTCKVQPFSMNIEIFDTLVLCVSRCKKIVVIIVGTITNLKIMHNVYIDFFFFDYFLLSQLL
jgi:hypothetical protein